MNIEIRLLNGYPRWLLEVFSSTSLKIANLRLAAAKVHRQNVLFMVARSSQVTLVRCVTITFLMT